MTILDLLRSGASDEEVVAWDETATDAEREASVDQLRALAFNERDDEHVFLACLVAGRSAEEVNNLARYPPRPERTDLLERIIARRTERWRNDYVRIVTRDEFGDQWPLLRAIMRAGTSVEPGQLYLAKFRQGMVRIHRGQGSGEDLVASLRADPGLIDDELFQVLGTEGEVRTLAGGWGMTLWLDALQILAGTDLRNRLLDAAWAGLVSDWRPVDQRPLLELLKRVAPDHAELEARLPGLVRMTTAENGPVVVWALKQLTLLLAAGQLDAQTLLSVRGPMTMRDKPTATAHLALLEKAVRAGTADPSALAEVAALALDHPHDVVRERATKFVAKHAPDLAKLSSAVTEPVAAEPHARPAPTPVERLGSAAEYVELLISSVMTERSPIELEQLVEATPRFAPALDSKARGAVFQAVRKGPSHFRTFGVWHLTDEVAGHDIHQGYDKRPWTAPTSFDSHYYESVLEMRTGQIRLAMRRSDVLVGLALPSLSDGSITGDAVEERMRALEGRNALQAELATIALRLRPEDREVVTSLATPAGRKLADLVRRVSAAEPVWASRRGGDGSGPQSRVHRPGHLDGNPPYGVVEDTSSRPPGGPDALSVLFDRRLLAGSSRARDETMFSWLDPIGSRTRLLSLTLPFHREHYASHVLGLIRTASQASGENWDCPPVPATILGLGTGPGRTEVATLAALATATATPKAEDRAAAVDAIVERAMYGELDGSGLGRELADMLRLDGVTSQRAPKVLAEAATALGPYAGPLHDAIVEVLPLVRELRDGHAYASLLADLSTSLGRQVTVPPELADLAKAKSGTALARAVRRLQAR